MKLEMTLEERPGFLHALPLFDLFVLVTMLLLLEPMFLSEGGVTVEVPTSQFQMQRFHESIVVTIGPGDDAPRLHLGRQAVTIEELKAELQELKADATMGRAVVLLKSDAGVSVGLERSISEMILGTGFNLALVGKSESEMEATGANKEKPE